MNEQDYPQGTKIIEIKQETPTVKTVVFQREFNFKPGQFVMVWVPGLDEVPMSLSSKNSITIKDVGETTHALHAMKPSDKIGLRGPYGNGFSLKEKNILAVGGGFGTAPLKPLFKNTNIKWIIGARNKEELLFTEEIDTLICTDDGSKGEKAFVTVLADRELATGKYDLVISCGPEIMLKNLFKVCEQHNINAEFSLERYMKCGFGICGHCAMDPTGWMVCKDGPVANSKILRELKEFGEYTRDKKGEVTSL
ncbi:dihydroorotate dehydrogenase electron transfer subunit [archaeon]|nr:dihydroorotate dehydrogenase electron transfer subunit [archaeon]